MHSDSNVTGQKTIAIFFRIITAIVIIGIGLYFISKWQAVGKPGTYKAELVWFDNVSFNLNDSKRVIHSGNAEIKIEKGERGELTYVVPSDTTAMGKYNTVITPAGGRFNLRLPDSSLIWLNAESSVRYPVDFSTDSIKLEFLGEAYIEITPETKHNYTIILSPTYYRPPPVTLQVPANISNPHFNIRNYMDDPESISMIENDNDTVAWKNGKILFHNADLQTIMREVSRWYAVDVDYLGRPTDKKYNLNLSRDANIKEVIAALEKQGVHLSLFLGEIVVRS